MPTLKGTEASLSYIQFLVSSSVNLFFTLHGWIHSGQTLYSYTHIPMVKFDL